jgi:hypothetical protein
MDRENRNLHSTPGLTWQILLTPPRERQLLGAGSCARGTGGPAVCRDVRDGHQRGRAAARDHRLQRRDVDLAVRRLRHDLRDRAGALAHLRARPARVARRGGQRRPGQGVRRRRLHAVRVHPRLSQGGRLTGLRRTAPLRVGRECEAATHRAPGRPPACRATQHSARRSARRPSHAAAPRPARLRSARRALASAAVRVG